MDKNKYKKTTVDIIKTKQMLEPVDVITTKKNYMKIQNGSYMKCRYSKAK